MPHFGHDRRAGPIDGLHLPGAAWTALRRQHITTLDQLKAVAGRLEWFDGIGPTIAQAIREELAQVVPSEEEPADKG
jgi:hypothetical protein